MDTNFMISWPFAVNNEQNISLDMSLSELLYHYLLNEKNTASTPALYNFRDVYSILNMCGELYHLLG